MVLVMDATSPSRASSGIVTWQKQGSQESAKEQDLCGLGWEPFPRHFHHVLLDKVVTGCKVSLPGACIQGEKNLCHTCSLLQGGLAKKIRGWNSTGSKHMDTSDKYLVMCRMQRATITPIDH